MLMLLGLCVAGGLQAASLAWPVDWGGVRGAPCGALQVLAQAWLVHQLRQAPSVRSGAWRAGVFAWAWLVGSVAWLYVSMHRYGGLSVGLAAGAVAVLAAALALYAAAAGGAYVGLCVACGANPAARGTGAIGAARPSALSSLARMAADAGGFAALWTLAEMARGTWLTGFGWGGTGYAHVESALAPAYAWVGVYGVAALAAWLAALLAQAGAALAQRQGRAALWALALALATVAALGLAEPPSGRSLPAVSVTLLQGNIAQEEKFEPARGVAQSLRWYAQQIASARTDWVITPETALPVLPDQLPEAYLDGLQAGLIAQHRAALIGLPLGNMDEGYTNSVIGLTPARNTPWRYDKHHLVPFGEFIPPTARWFTDLMRIPLGDFARGPLPQAPLAWGGQRLGVSICYENVFTQEMAAAFAPGLTPPTVLVNLSNLGWFGEHLAMDQHLAIARVRSLELDRPALLATNTGRSAILNHRAQVVAAAPAHTRTALVGWVQGREGLTPYARWVGRWGLWPLVVVAVLVLLGLAWARRWRASR